MVSTELKLGTEKMLARKEDGIGWMTFNNPERRNALGIEMQEAIPAILGDFAADDEVRVVVMSGAGGKAFVSGADISEFEQRRSSPDAIAEYDRISGDAFRAYQTLGKPLIAMIQGFCMGGGLLTAMRADLRIASDDSQFGVPAARLGLGYGYGGVKALVDLVGVTHTREILLTGKRFPAEDAMRWGLVNRVVPVEQLEETVVELAATIAENAPLTIKAIRKSVDETLKDESRRDLASIESLVAECFASEDYKEGRSAFMEKRRPAFRGR
jgi:enoyl-CoA hydratase/carnithine racemase